MRPGMQRSLFFLLSLAPPTLCSPPIAAIAHTSTSPFAVVFNVQISAQKTGSFVVEVPKAFWLMQMASSERCVYVALGPSRLGTSRSSALPRFAHWSLFSACCSRISVSMQS